MVVFISFPFTSSTVGVRIYRNNLSSLILANTTNAIFATCSLASGFKGYYPFAPIVSCYLKVYITTINSTLVPVVVCISFPFTSSTVGVWIYSTRSSFHLATNRTYLFFFTFCLASFCKCRYPITPSVIYNYSKLTISKCRIFYSVLTKLNCYTCKFRRNIIILALNSFSAKNVSEVSICTSVSTCTNKRNSQSRWLVSFKCAKCDANCIIGYYKFLCKTSLVSIKYVSYISSAVSVIFPPCRIIKATILYVSYSIGKFYFCKIWECIIIIKIISTSCAFLYDKLYKFWTVKITLWLKKSIGNTSVCRKCECYTISTSTCIIKYVVIYFKIS